MLGIIFSIFFMVLGIIGYFHDDIYEAMQLFFISSIFFLGYSIQFRYIMGNARFNKIVSAISETLEKFLKTYKEDKK